MPRRYFRFTQQGSNVDMFEITDRTFKFFNSTGGAVFDLNVDDSELSISGLLFRAGVGSTFTHASGGDDVGIEGDLEVLGSVALAELSADPTNLANRGIDYTKEVSTITERFYIDSAGNVTQLTSGGVGGIQDLWATISSDSGSTTANAVTDTLTIAGGEGIDTSISGDTLTAVLDLNEIPTDTSIASGDLIAFVDITDNGNQKITFANFEGILNHDNLAGFVLDEHVAHTGVTLTAGEGLSGGGDISVSRSFAIALEELTTDTSIAAGDFIPFRDISPASNDKITFANFEGALDHDSLTGFVTNEHIDHTAVTLTAGEGLSGGGDISANRAFAIALEELTTDTSIAAGDFIPFHDISPASQDKITFANFEGALNHDSLTGFVTNEHIDHSGVNIDTATGLTGGGDITATRTLDYDINALTAQGTPTGAADYVVIFDAGLTAHRKVLLDDLPGTGGALIDVQTFTSSGTWTKPSGATLVLVEVWGAGGGGGRDATDAGGGGGGAYVQVLLAAGDAGANETVTIGAGGTGRAASDGDGTVGGNSTFGSLVTGYGGGGGGDGGGGPGGGGGGALEAGTTASGATGSDGGRPDGGAGASAGPGSDSGFGGGGGGDGTVDAIGGFSGHGGGGGGGGGDSVANAAGGASLNGGGGGGGARLANGGTGGTSVTGGAGGAGGGGASSGSVGTQPGGGGGGSDSTSGGDGGNGGAGQIIVSTWN